MLASYLIGLREGLEASLVVGILIAYLVKSDRRAQLPKIWAGVGAAVALSLGFGALLTFGSRTMDFKAQEAFGGFASLVAVGLVTWMVFWMRRTGRALRSTLHGQLDKAVATSALALVVVAFVSVGREGLETALFLWAAAEAASNQGAANQYQPLIGAILGLTTAVVAGWLIYRGAVRLNLATFFRWSGLALIVVAAGVLSYGIHDLQEAEILPGLNTLAFDVSDTISPSSWLGVLLKGTVNFTPATTWLQLIAWACYLVPTLVAYARPMRQQPVAPPAPAPVPVG
jgi:high-affinity iron transporter